MSPYSNLNRRFIFAVCGLLVLSVALAPAGPVEVMIKFVTIGDPRNPDRDLLDVDRENGGMGYVGQEFQMAEAEVTNEMYARFLNAVAKADRLYGLYSTLMGTSSDGGIVRTGSQGSYAYQVKSGYGNRPVNFVSNFDAMRFSNWLHNGMPGDPSAEDPTRRTPLSGDQTAFSTEDGAYSLLGANNGEIIRRNAGARFYLPDRDEWFKSAYFDPSPGGGRPSDSYWLFADQSDSGPGGNFGPTDSDGQPFKYGDENINLEPIKTSSGPSHYGTYDQDGNAAEWLDATIASGERFVGRGGGEISTDPVTGYTLITLDDFKTELPLTEVNYLGFRVAKRVVHPATGLGIAPPVMVEVGDPRNPGDDTGPGDSNGIQYRRGRVDYTFQMGAYEVTNGDYVKFLNAVAKDDTFYRLYDSRMQTDARGGITRSGSNGSYVYQTRAGFAKMPVNFVSLWSAMRYCNWLHNGAQPNGDTEAGAYRLLGNIPPNTSKLIRNPSALYFLPTENEWYKAAFYDPSVTAEATANYWAYATRADNAQKSIINYAGLAAVDVDAYLAQSYFGTFQQSGNIAEWTETIGRRVLGGSWESAEAGISASGGEAFPPETKSATIGFRIAAAPEALTVKFASDGDNDGMRDAWELLYGLNPSDPSDADKDADGDGLSNRREFELGLLPLAADSDGDGLGDGAEVGTWKTAPANPDSDSDGLSDGAEVNTHRTDANKSDTDGDGLQDGLEVETLGTNPLAPQETPFFSLVGDPANPEDFYTEDLRGHVAGEFDMGVSEVTNLMYAKFLNAVARQGDPKGLYSPYMKLDPQGGIVRSGSESAYSYAVKPGFQGKPVNFVSYYDSLRYVNWLHNGMPNTGRQDLETTEAGVYRLPPPLTPVEDIRIQRNPDALYFLPDASEWHKAAYYDPDRTPSETYWPFADRTDFGPGGNFSTTAASGGESIRLASVGTSSGSSRYGTLDQDGNVGEWLEVLLPAGPVPVNFGRKAEGGGGLTLHIDILRNRFWFTGSATGSFGSRFRRATWSILVPSLTQDPESRTSAAGLVGDATALFTSAPGRGVAAVEIGSTEFSGRFRFTVIGESAGEATVVGRGPEFYVDYGGVSATMEFNFEFDVESSATYEVGDSTFGPLAVEYTDWDDAAASAAGEPANIELDPNAERVDVGFRVARSLPPSVVPPPAVLPQLVTVGEPRNAGDPDAGNAGGVDYTYKIGAYEVTNDEYAAFLNAVAKSDALYGLFDSRMTTSLLGGILRKGSAGSYSYSVKPGFGRKPVVFVSSYDAMRYCNWLHNGAQAGSDTESGAYRLLGELSPGEREIRRSFGARYFLPSKDEWRKAAYYDSSADAELTGNYWQFAMRADNATPSQIAVGGSTGLVDVNKPGLSSYFGTFGQSGNAAEWTEETAEAARLVLGGGVASNWADPSAAAAFYADPTEAALDRGFRIAARGDSPAARVLSLQTMKFGKLPAKRVIGTKPFKINLRAKASSNLPVTFEVTDPAGIATFQGSTAPSLLVDGPGVLTITARQSGGGQWAPVQVTQTVEIVPRKTK